MHPDHIAALVLLVPSVLASVAALCWIAWDSIGS